MMKVDITLKHEKDVQDTYVEPDVWSTTITISDPLVHEQNGKKTHTSYKVETVTSYPKFEGTKFSVRRRYNDFVWLRGHLEHMLNSRKWKRPVERLPELPGDTMASFFGWGRFEPDFIEKRRVELELFLQKCANHPQCATDIGLIRFLKEPDLQPVIEFFSL